jgi:putative transcriptional regulator
MNPRSGALLVASPQLHDVNFRRSVVYLLDHSKSGSLGFVVNRPLEVPLSELWNEVPAALADARIAADGGPVDRHRGLLLHSCLDLAGAQLMGEGVAVGGELDALAERYAAGSDSSGPRLFLGHSGWGPGQLEHEIEEGSWILRPGRVSLLIEAQPSDLLWKQLIEGYLGSMPDPSLN